MLDREVLQEAKEQLTDPKLLELLRSGLADKNDVENVKRALRYGEDALKNPSMRMTIYKTFDRLLGVVKGDSNIRAKVKQELRDMQQVKEGNNMSNDLNTDNVEKAIAHDCAKHVVHETWGRGECIPGQHTLDEVSEGVGIVTHYDVMFEHGIEQDVPVSELEILVSESHMHSKKKKMAEELKPEFANNHHPELDDDGIPGKRYYSNTDANGKKIKPKFALPKAFPGLGKAANQGMKLGVRKEEVEQVDEMDKSQPSSSRGAEGLPLGKKAEPVKTDKVKSDALKALQKRYEKVKEEVELDETTGVTNYNPRSQGGTRKELLAKLAKSKSPEHAEAARKAGATQLQLKAAMMSEEVEQVNEAPLSPEHKAAIKTLQNIPKDYSHSELKLLSKHADSIASKAANAAHAAKKKADPFKETGSTMTNADGHKIHLKKVGANSFEYTAHATKGGPAISNKFGQSLSSIRNAHKKGMYDKHFKEEVEQVNELKKSTLASYATKAAKNIRTSTKLAGDFESDKYAWRRIEDRHAPWNLDHPKQDKDPEKYKEAKLHSKAAGDLENDYRRAYRNRIKGIGRAAAKLAKEEVEGTHPKTEKEKKLAGLAPPHDKITHADVMVGRGVNKKTMKEFVEQLAKHLPSEEE